METAAEPRKTSGITLRDKIGYGMGDMGGTLFLGMSGSFLQLFYTKVLHLSQVSISTLFLILRIWDGVNDPIWGTIVDRRPAGKHGKFRPYLRNFSIPLALCGVLLFTRVPGLSQFQYLLYAYITHILFEFFYTTTNIPLGSLASVITDDGAERSQLSVYRSIGSGVGGLPAAIILPLFIYSGSGEGKYLDPQKLFIAMLILAAASVTIHMLAFRMITERVPPPPAEEKHSLLLTAKTLLRNRPYLAISAASMLLSAITFYTQPVTNFLYNDYFKRPELYSLVTIATYASTPLLLPFIQKLVLRFGKKRLCAWGLVLSAAANAAALLSRTENPYVFMGFCFFSGLGGTFMSMELWALVTDALDYQELLSRKREEGTCYSLFFFIRKLGQTLANSGSPFLMHKMGYVETPDSGGTPIPVVQPPQVARRMFTIATLVPAIIYALIALVMAFWYPLDPKGEEEVREELRARRAAMGDG